MYAIRSYYGLSPLSGTDVPPVDIDGRQLIMSGPGRDQGDFLLQRSGDARGAHIILAAWLIRIAFEIGRNGKTQLRPLAIAGGHFIFLRNQRKSASLIFVLYCRITSYNVCYTKLLRGAHIDSDRVKMGLSPLSGADVPPVKIDGRQLIMSGPGRDQGDFLLQRSGDARITSYNVCYTKLLRMSGNHITD